MKEKLAELKAEVDNLTIVRDFSTHLSVMHRIGRRSTQK